MTCKSVTSLRGLSSLYGRPDMKLSLHQKWYCIALIQCLIVCLSIDRGLLKEQTNLDQHTIGCDEIKLNLTAHVNGTTEFPNNLRFNLTSQHLPCDPPIFKPLNPCVS